MLGVALKDFDSDRTLFLYSTSNKYHGSVVRPTLKSVTETLS